MKKVFLSFALVLSLSSATLAHEVGDKVESDWDGDWYKATILEIAEGRYKVRFDNYGSDADIWVKAEQIRARKKETPRIAAKVVCSKKGKYLVGVESLGACAYSPDGHYLAAGSDYGTIKFIGIPDFELLTETEIIQSKITAIVFSPDAKLYAAGCRDGTVQIRDVKTHEIKSSIKGLHEITGLAFARTGKALAVSASTSNNTRLSTAALFDSASGKKILDLVRPAPVESWYAMNIAASSDGSLVVVSAANKKKGVEVFDAQSGKRITRISYPSDINQAVFSPDGSLILGASSDGKLPVWDMQGHLKFAATWGENSATSIAVDTQGRFFAAAGRDGGSPIKVFSMKDGSELDSPRKGNPVGNEVSISPDGKSVAVCYQTYGDLFETTILEVFHIEPKSVPASVKDQSR